MECNSTHLSDQRESQQTAGAADNQEKELTSEAFSQVSWEQIYQGRHQTLQTNELEGTRWQEHQGFFIHLHIQCFRDVWLVPDCPIPAEWSWWRNTRTTPEAWASWQQHVGRRWMPNLDLHSGAQSNKVQTQNHIFVYSDLNAIEGFHLMVTD